MNKVLVVLEELEDFVKRNTRSDGYITSIGLKRKIKKLKEDKHE